MIGVVIAGEMLLNAVIVWRVRYTEIDWMTYMQQVAVPMDGVFDYAAMTGDTGPLVYPAAHVWIFSALRVVTQGVVIKAQVIFAGIYVVNIALVAWIYAVAAPRSFPPFLLPILSCSKRVHSIFVLRLFNDGPATTLAHAGVLLFVHRRWTLGCILYSISVATKMNFILYSPALAVLLLHELGLPGLVKHVLLCVVVQVILAAPFLATAPATYMRGAFNIGRTFKHKWSVNFKWVPCAPRALDEVTLLEDCDGVFTSPVFATSLLVLTAVLLLAFAHRHWLGARRGGLRGMFHTLAGGSPKGPRIAPREAARALFCSNFVGIALARSLHFQFYVWYFYSLPLLAWSTRLPVPVRVALLVAIEAAWNPWAGETSSTASSVLLTVCHLVLLAGLLAKDAGDEDKEE